MWFRAAYHPGSICIRLPQYPIELDGSGRRAPNVGSVCAYACGDEAGGPPGLLLCAVLRLVRGALPYDQPFCGSKPLILLSRCRGSRDLAMLRLLQRRARMPGARVYREGHSASALHAGPYYISYS